MTININSDFANLAILLLLFFQPKFGMSFISPEAHRKPIGFVSPTAHDSPPEMKLLNDSDCMLIVGYLFTFFTFNLFALGPDLLFLRIPDAVIKFCYFVICWRRMVGICSVSHHVSAHPNL